MFRVSGMWSPSPLHGTLPNPAVLSQDFRCRKDDWPHATGSKTGRLSFVVATRPNRADDGTAPTPPEMSAIASRQPSGQARRSRTVGPGPPVAEAGEGHPDLRSSTARRAMRVRLRDVAGQPVRPLLP
jgi:hypothetical protein